MAEQHNGKYTVIFEKATIYAVDAQGKTYTEELTNEMQGAALNHVMAVLKTNIATPSVFAHRLSVALCHAGVEAIIKSFPRESAPAVSVYGSSQINGHTGALEHIFTVMCAYERVATFTASVAEDRQIHYLQTPAKR
jgi:23S rRNA U2552 (ribose-2'-O)-methylase RlmE/FtsJ